METIQLSIIGVWLTILTAINIWLFVWYRNLTSGLKKTDFNKLISKVIESDSKNKLTVERFSKQLEKFDRESETNIKKLGLVRFNPFNEIGGDHSFVIALLDKNDNGVLITGLHTRERTRVYVKKIKQGKCDLELSEDEKKAIKAAQKSVK